MRFITIFLFVLIGGCATTGGKVDPSVASMKDHPIFVEDVSHDHIHNYSSVAVGAMIGGVVGALVAEGISEGSHKYDESYIDKLNSNVTKELIDSVTESDSFNITQIRTDDKLEITIDYGFAANSIFQKSPVALLTRWVLKDKNGNKLFNIVTKVKAKDAPDDTPSSTDPKYYDTFVLLAKQSGEDFNLIIQGKPAKWGAKDFRFTN